MKICALFLVFGLATGADWSYAGENGEQTWSSISNVCGMARQSPIDIPAVSDTKYDSSIGQITMVGYDNMASSNLKIKNNGHSAVLEITDMTSGPYMTGGGLPDKYVAVQAHYHWGMNDGSGSEHTFNGVKYPLELHIVHMRESYDNLTYALTQPDGLAVLGFFYVVSAENEDNAHLTPLINALDQIRFKGQSQDISINYADLMSEKKDEFYRYMGSLTTPTCNEAVVWTVFENKVPISSAQLAHFRGLHETAADAGIPLPLKWNYRKVQELNDRKVKRNYMASVPPSYHWGYEGHEDVNSWQTYYPRCVGTTQSPIDIPAFGDSHVLLNSNLATLQFKNYEKVITGTLLNNGHTVQVNLDDTDISIHGGGLGGEYQAAQFHFHWGQDNMHGSEHTREGHSYPLEVHIVHFKKDYRSLLGALSYPDGLAVVGFFFEVTDTTNTGYSRLISKLVDVKYKGLQQPITGFTMEDVTSEHLFNNVTGEHLPFFRYAGSLTTPPCSDIVTWTVMMNPIRISSAQMAEFRKMLHVTENEAAVGNDHAYIKKNYRPAQTLGKRMIYASYIPPEVALAPTFSSNCALLFTPVLFMFLSR